MRYYPKSQITPNLYTDGSEFIILSSNQPYTGPYFKVSNGEIYTGKNPNDTPSLKLTPITSLPPDNIDGDFSPNDVIPLNKLYENYPDTPDFNLTYSSNSIVNNRSLPSPIQTRPTKKDYDLGVFSRYIVKKNNENVYVEINKEQFIKFQNRDEDVAWDLYTPKEILWQIKGDKTQTYTTNKNTIELVENREKWYGFTQWFKDRFLKYYK